MTGMQNLRQYARLRGVKQSRIDEVVELVSMSNRVDEKVKKYSLGMRQRIGVALSLLHRPKLLILDEPTNGLDPAGIKELRDILRVLTREEKIGVMVSSHLMSEMELMCDRVGIITNGTLIDVKPVDELIASVRKPVITYKIKTDDAKKAYDLIDNVSAEDKSVVGENILELKLNAREADEIAGAVTQRIVRGGLMLYSVVPCENNSLEDAFIEITQSGGVQIV
jgi:ABC-2 type transport system ATP-binding protein